MKEQCRAIYQDDNNIARSGYPVKVRPCLPEVRPRPSPSLSPRYMLHTDIKTNGLLSAAPMLARYVGGLLLCRLADWLVRSGRLGLRSSRRIFNTVSQMCPALAMVGGVQHSETLSRWPWATLAAAPWWPRSSWFVCQACLSQPISQVVGFLFNGACSAGHIARWLPSLG